MSGGDPINLVDGPVDLLERYGRLVDRRRFEESAVAALFAPRVSFEFPWLLGSEPAELTRSALAAWLRTFYGTFTAVTHVFESSRARVEDGRADLYARMVATHELGAEQQQGWPATWSLEGAVEGGAVRGPAGWRLQRVCLTIASQRGEAAASVALALAGAPGTDLPPVRRLEPRGGSAHLPHTS
jgi:hypothetical protein